MLTLFGLRCSGSALETKKRVGPTRKEGWGGEDLGEASGLIVSGYDKVHSEAFLDGLSERTAVWVAKD